MTVYRRGAVWYYDFRVDRRRFVKRVGPSRAIAKKAETIARARALKGRYSREWGLTTAGRVPTLEEFFAPFARELPTSYAKGTVGGMRSAIGKFVAMFPQLLLTEITAEHVVRYKAERLTTIHQNTLRLHMGWLQRFFAAAVGVYLEKNPLAGVARPRYLRPDYHVPTATEERRIVRACTPQIRADMVRITSLLALRRAETVRLKNRAIDLRARVATVRQEKRQTEKTIPLVPEAVAILRRYVRETEPDAPVFVSRRGRAFSPSTLWWYFSQARRAAGLPGVRLHDLRHAVGTQLAAQREDTATIGEILGHQAPYRATLVYTAHTSDARKRKALQRMAAHRARESSNGPTTTGRKSGR